jgi:hypothetical protein
MRQARRVDPLAAITQVLPSSVAPYSSVPNFVQRMVGRGLIARDLDAFLVLDRQAAGSGWCDLSAEGLAHQLHSTYAHRAGERVARSTANECLRRLTACGVIRSERRIALIEGQRRDLPARRYLLGCFRHAGRKVTAARAARAQASAQKRRSLMCPNPRTPTESEEVLTDQMPEASTPEGRALGLAACRAALRGEFFGATGPPGHLAPPFPLPQVPETTPTNARTCEV